MVNTYSADFCLETADIQTVILFAKNINSSIVNRIPILKQELEPDLDLEKEKEKEKEKAQIDMQVLQQVRTKILSSKSELDQKFITATINCIKADLNHAVAHLLAAKTSVPIFEKAAIYIDLANFRLAQVLLDRNKLIACDPIKIKMSSFENMFDNISSIITKYSDEFCFANMSIFRANMLNKNIMSVVPENRPELDWMMRNQKKELEKELEKEPSEEIERLEKRKQEEREKEELERKKQEEERTMARIAAKATKRAEVDVILSVLSKTSNELKECQARLDPATCELAHIDEQFNSEAFKTGEFDCPEIFEIRKQNQSKYASLMDEYTRLKQYIDELNMKLKKTLSECNSQRNYD
jgi:hypothetical protein